jgi:hypothetical protein
LRLPMLREQQRFQLRVLHVLQLSARTAGSRLSRDTNCAEETAASAARRRLFQPARSPAIHAAAPAPAARPVAKHACSR